MKFAENLRFLRKSKNITQKELAEQLSVDKRQISKLETQYNESNIDMLIKLANFFGCSVDYLLGRDQEDGAFVMDGLSNSLSDIEQHLISVCRTLNKRLQIKLLGYADGLYTGQQEGHNGIWI